MPEPAGLGAVAPGAVIDRDDVAAGAQAALARAGQQHGADVVVVLPVGQRLRRAVTMAWVSELIALGRLSVIRPTPLVDGY